MSDLAVLYIGKLSDESDFQQLRHLLGPSYVAQFSFESALHGQLSATPGLSLSSLSFILGPTYPRRPLIGGRHCSGSDALDRLRFINLPFCREVTLFTSTVLNLLNRWLRREVVDVIFLATSFTPVTLGARFMSRLLRARLVLTLTDLSGFSYRESRVAQMSASKRAVVGAYRKLAGWTEASADAFVLFSAEMRKKVDIGGAPYLVMEGMYKPRETDAAVSPELSRRVVAHAGTLDKQYGVGRMIAAFNEVVDDETELWLIGSGDMDDEIRHQAGLNPRIKFFGFLPQPEVFELLSRARLLVNLRDPRETFTSYSFPSKLFEFMATGVPVASTRLRGIPDEYFAFIFPVDALEPASVARILEQILDEDRRLLAERGQRGRQFVLNSKSPEAQTRRIVEFLRGICDRPAGPDSS